MAKHPGDRIAGEAALREEPVLPCPLADIGGRCAEALAPRGAGALALGLAQRLDHRRGHRGIEPMGTELVLDAAKAEALRTTPCKAGGESLRGQPSVSLELIERTLERLRRVGERRDLAAEFETTVLALCQQSKCPSLQGRAGPLSLQRGKRSGLIPGRGLIGSNAARPRPLERHGRLGLRLQRPCRLR